MCLQFLLNIPKQGISPSLYKFEIKVTITNRIHPWISAFRPRTLFLAAAGVILGSGLALHVGKLNLITALLTLLTALLLQLLSNLANDLGDYVKGTDRTGRRVGPIRSVQSGKITPLQMKRATAITTLITMLSGLILLLRLFHIMGLVVIILFLIVGALSLLSALFYTLGKRPYGYKGWGDFFAFLFFGPIAVMGTYYLQAQTIDFRAVLPSIGMGLLSAMILNVNNMRDIENDALSKKRTIAVRIGLINAKRYHATLLIVMYGCFLLYNMMYASNHWCRFGYIVVFVFQFILLVEIFKKEGEELDPYLRKTAISSFMLAVLFSVCVNIF